ncbi:hypothetical protein STCU_01656 [Strigomonas culicis]|uniref:Uncharacterized protein n=1 Tax=Strigomonas culicis TaxID=28005 RepID=S9UZX0_9TRYP|nr:hypothetical protein STCU_01656 [Strigomonas culicis]|eukprot:EPY34314.1 hypothetical protein STCU_01656 [Strigomonas culicis]
MPASSCWWLVSAGVAHVGRNDRAPRCRASTTPAQRMDHATRTQEKKKKKCAAINNNNNNNNKEEGKEEKGSDSKVYVTKRIGWPASIDDISSSLIACQFCKRGNSCHHTHAHTWMWKPFVTAPMHHRTAGLRKITKSVAAQKKSATSIRVQSRVVAFVRDAVRGVRILPVRPGAVLLALPLLDALPAEPRVLLRLLLLRRRRLGHLPLHLRRLLRREVLQRHGGRVAVDHQLLLHLLPEKLLTRDGAHRLARQTPRPRERISVHRLRVLRRADDHAAAGQHRVGLSPERQLPAPHGVQRLLVLRRDGRALLRLDRAQHVQLACGELQLVAGVIDRPPQPREGALAQRLLLLPARLLQPLAARLQQLAHAAPLRVKVLHPRLQLRPRAAQLARLALQLDALRALLGAVDAVPLHGLLRHQLHVLHPLEENPEPRVRPRERLLPRQRRQRGAAGQHAVRVRAQLRHPRGAAAAAPAQQRALAGKALRCAPGNGGRIAPSLRALQSLVEVADEVRRPHHLHGGGAVIIQAVVRGEGAGGAHTLPEQLALGDELAHEAKEAAVRAGQRAVQHLRVVPLRQRAEVALDGGATAVVQSGGHRTRSEEKSKGEVLRAGGFKDAVWIGV